MHIAPVRFVVIVFFAVFFAVFFCGAVVECAHATAGFAEWEVYTLGGNIIRHTDGWKEEHGTCLTADDSDTKLSKEDRDRVVVEHMKRWRYYRGYVAAETEAAPARGTPAGFVLMDERTRKTEPFSNEAALTTAVTARPGVAPLSEWLDGSDGHAEAWLPYFVWGPCKETMRSGKPVEGGPSAADCKALMAKERLKLYWMTTWGRTCKQLPADKAREPNLSSERRDEQLAMEYFCSELKAAAEAS